MAALIVSRRPAITERQELSVPWVKSLRMEQFTEVIVGCEYYVNIARVPGRSSPHTRIRVLTVGCKGAIRWDIGQYIVPQPTP